MATVFRPPLIQNLYKVKTGVAGDVWGMPSVIRDSIVSAPIPPGGSVEWNPPRAKPYPLDLRTFINYYVIDDNAPFNTTDWPNPRLKRRGSLGDQVALSALSLTTSIVTPPVGRSDFGWPSYPGLNRDLRGSVDASEFWMLKDTMFGAAGQPLTPIPEPLPRVKGISVDHKTWLQNLLNSTLALPVFAPRVMHDWPNPRGVFVSPALRTHLNTTSLLLKDSMYGPAGKVPAYDWPIPKVKGLNRVDQWIQNLLESTIAPPVTGIPTQTAFVSWNVEGLTLRTWNGEVLTFQSFAAPNTLVSWNVENNTTTTWNMETNTLTTWTSS